MWGTIHFDSINILILSSCEHYDQVTYYEMKSPFQAGLVEGCILCYGFENKPYFGHIWLKSNLSKLSTKHIHDRNRATVVLLAL